MTLVSTSTAPIRVRSIDLLRGIAMVIMVVDHIRDFWGPTPFDPGNLQNEEVSLWWFFTRWITHFCAPVFVFLAGTSAFLYRHNGRRSRAQLSRFLLTRGIWLALVEIIAVSFFWQFGANFILLQVIWAIGVSMILLAGLIWLPYWLLLAVGVGLVGFHNLLDSVDLSESGSAGLVFLWSLLHQTGMHEVLGFKVSVRYPLMPWVGLMVLGYAFGRIFVWKASVRDRSLVGLGLGMVLLFILLRLTTNYGDPRPLNLELEGVRQFLAYLSATKYPPSLLFILMTLGPAIALMPLLERMRGRPADVLLIFGRVPFFFYLLHLPVINATSAVWNYSFYGSHNWWMKWTPLPDNYEPSLILVWVAWALTVALLYWPCRWFANYKRTHKAWWLSYL